MKVIKLLSLFLVIFGASSCNTLVGIGRDIKQTGGGIESKAQGSTFKAGATNIAAE